MTSWLLWEGPQSACSLDKFPYLFLEIDLIKSALSQGKKILGVCLGAQLIGTALRHKAEPSLEKEVGGFPITLAPTMNSDPLLKGLLDSFLALHWHHDMPGLTEESHVLASSPGCPRQIICYKDTVYGLQCHLEITQAGISTLIRAFPEDLTPSTFTHSRQELLEADYGTMNSHMIDILDQFALLGTQK